MIRWTWLALAAWPWAWLLALPPPLGPRNAWLAAVAGLPLLFLLPGIWRRQPRAQVWGGFLALPYLVIGIVEAWSNPPQRLAALVQVMLSGGYFACLSVAARRRRVG